MQPADRAEVVGTGRSYWQRLGGMPADGAAVRGSPELPQRADVVVIGGGFAGLATAIRIMEVEPAARVVLLEAKSIGYGASGRNGGLMSPLPAPIWLASATYDSGHRAALAALNVEVGKAAAWARALAPDAEVLAQPLVLEAKGHITDAGIAQVARIVSDAGIACRLESGATAGSPRALSIETHTVNPYRLALGLADHARRLGVEVIEQAPVVRIAQSGSVAQITLGDGRSIAAASVVVATNACTPSLSLPEPARAKVVHNYMLATEPLDDEMLARLDCSGRFVVELNSAYVFYRVHQRRLVFGGIEKLSQKAGGDFDVPAEVMRGLERHLGRTLSPGALPRIADAWGGRFHMTSTDLPIIRRSERAPSVVLNVGYGGTGVALTLTLAPLAAALALRRAPADAALGMIGDTMRRTGMPVLGAARFAAAVARRLVFGPRPG